MSALIVDNFIDALRDRGYSEATLRAYRSDLDGFYEWVDYNKHVAPPQRAAAYLNAHRQSWAAKTSERRLTTLRSFSRWLGHPDLLADYRPPKSAPPEPHPIPEGIDGVLRMIHRTRNPRKRALVTLCGLMGLRVAEAVSIAPDDFLWTGGPRRPESLRVRGKGAKDRLVPVTDKSWSYLERAYNLAAADKAALVRMSQSGARKAITRLGELAGLSRPISSHDLRATFATAAYEKTHDLRAVQDLLGHSDPKQTMVYTGVSKQAKKAAAEVA